MSNLQDVFDPLENTPDQGKTTVPWYHFSIDDVFDSLIDVTDNRIPLFEYPYFALLKRLHDEYGLTVGLHLFYEKTVDGVIRSLKDVRDLRQEIKADGDWIYFAPHALNFDTPPYDQLPADQIKTFEQIYAEIDRFAGKRTYAKWVRLHYYSESFELANYFAEKGVSALFSTDRDTGSHRMTKKIKDDLINVGSAKYEGMNFIRTHFRIEFFANESLSNYDIKRLFADAIEKYKYVILYTHEYEFDRTKVCQYLEDSCIVLKELGISPLSHT